MVLKYSTVNLLMVLSTTVYAARYRQTVTLTNLIKGVKGLRDVNRR